MKQAFPTPNATYRSRSKSKDFTGEPIRYYIRNRKTKVVESYSLDGMRGYAKPLNDALTKYQFTLEGFPLPNLEEIDDSHDSSFIVSVKNLDLDQHDEL